MRHTSLSAALAFLPPWLRIGWHMNAGWLAALTLVLFAGVWLAHLSSSALSPPADNIEQLVWAHSLEWGYYKHPPLPTWVLWLPVQIFGFKAWTSYATGAMTTLAAMGIFWRLVSRLRGSRYATLSLFAVLCITYFNGRLYYYNHNILLLLLSTACAALCWKAWSTGQLRWWVALGVVFGLGLLTKYQIAVTMVSLGTFWVSQRGWRDGGMRVGLLLAVLVALLIFVPHLYWLRAHDFGPVQYAFESSLSAAIGPVARLLSVVNWLADQLLNRALPAWLLLVVLAYRSRMVLPESTPATSGPKPPTHAAGRALLLSWGLVPLVFMALVGLVAGSDLQTQWGTPFLLFAVPAAMELTSPRFNWSLMPMALAFRVFAAVQLLLLVLSMITSPQGPERLRDHHWRGFDSEKLARELKSPVQAALKGVPLCIVSGPPDIAGVVALQLRPQPQVLIEGRFDRSPWITPDSMRRCGVLQLQRDTPPAGGLPVGPDFPGVFWRVLLPAHNASAATAPISPALPEKR